MRLTAMTWVILTALAVTAGVCATPVRAADITALSAPETEQRAEPTTPAYVSMLFHRLTGAPPDFDSWAMASDAYGAANSFDRELVRREKAAEALRAYNLITFDDPVVVSVPVKLSSYSRMRQGFLIENFKPDTFYSYSFMGRDYALVPLDLMDYQWLSLPDAKSVAGINQKLLADDGRAHMVLWVTPVSADKENPLQVAGKNYWLLSGKVKKIKIYDKNGKHLIWEGVNAVDAAQNRQQVIDLYQ